MFGWKQKNRKIRQYRFQSILLPMTARSFFLNVCRDRKGRYYGTIGEIFYENDMAFYGLDDAILKIDQIQEQRSCM